MNKWEREVFLPKLEARPMSEKEYAKIARKYDYKHHDKTRVTFNNIHDAVKTINKVHNLVNNSTVNLQVKCPTPYKLKGKWLRAEFFKELQTGPMSQERFNYIMKNIGTDNTRKYTKEWDTMRDIANTIWSRAACNKNNNSISANNDQLKKAVAKVKKNLQKTAKKEAVA